MVLLFIQFADLANYVTKCFSGSTQGCQREKLTFFLFIVLFLQPHFEKRSNLIQDGVLQCILVEVVNKTGIIYGRLCMYVVLAGSKSFLQEHMYMQISPFFRIIFWKHKKQTKKNQNNLLICLLSFLILKQMGEISPLFFS